MPWSRCIAAAPTSPRSFASRCPTSSRWQRSAAVLSSAHERAIAARAHHTRHIVVVPIAGIGAGTARTRTFRRGAHGRADVEPRAGWWAIRARRSYRQATYRGGLPWQAAAPLFRLHILSGRLSHRPAIDRLGDRPAWEGWRRGAAAFRHARSG